MSIPLVDAAAARRVSSALWRVALRFARHFRRRMRRRVVAGFSEHLLKDIGVSRSEVACERQTWLPDGFTVYGSDSYVRIWGDDP
jgi:uncharacterized protein YjiS (DUF1127 family)